MSEKKSRHEIVVYSANALIDTIHHQKFSELELKVMYWIFTQISKDDIELSKQNIIKILHVPASELAHDLQFSHKKSFHNLKVLADSIQKKTMTSKSDHDFVKVVIIPTFQYKEGMITIGLHPLVLPHLIDLKEQYTKFHFENVIKLGSGYAIKLYTLLKQFQSFGFRTFKIEELREYFGITEDEYKQYAHFRVNILDISVTHINLHTDINIAYNEKKTWRKITEITFTIKEKKNEQKKIQIKNSQIEEIQSIISFFITSTKFDELLNKKIVFYLINKGEDYVYKAMLYVFNKKPKQIRPYFIKTLDNEWGQDIAIGELEHHVIKKMNLKSRLM